MKIVYFLKGFVGALFIGTLVLTSCVQGDLYDLMDDDECAMNLQVPRKKTKLDVGGGGINDDLNWILTHKISSNEYECFALALANYSGRSVVEMRRELGTRIWPNDPLWASKYRQSVTTRGGLNVSPETEERLIGEIVGASRMPDWEVHYYINNHKYGLSVDDKIIVGVNNDHWGILMSVEDSNFWNRIFIYLKDQMSNKHRYNSSQIDSAYI